MHTDTSCNARNRPHRFATAALILVVTVAGGTAQGSESSRGSRETQTHKSHKWTEIGKASWYGHRFQGRRTASGEAFDLNMLTCAHRTLPIGTLVRVTNLGNRRSIMVRVNDRGPVPAGLIVDLSYAAARSLGFNGRSNVRVRLEQVAGAEAAQLNWPNLGRPDAAPGTR